MHAVHIQYSTIKAHKVQLKDMLPRVTFAEAGHTEYMGAAHSPAATCTTLGPAHLQEAALCVGLEALARVCIGAIHNCVLGPDL